MTRRRALAASAAVAGALLVGCGGDGDDDPDATDFAGAWDVQLVVGAVQADPDAIVTTSVGDTFRERWVFEDCDEARCTLTRADGGLALGDLDGVSFEFVDRGSVDDTPRFTGRATATDVPRLDPAPPPEEEDEGDGDDGHDDPAGPIAPGGACEGTAARRWAVTIELDVREGVLSGTVLRIPEELRVVADGTECFGIDLTLGLSGLPGDGSEPTGPG